MLSLRIAFGLSCFLLSLISIAQQPVVDSAELETVVLQAFGGKSKLMQLPAAVALIKKREVESFVPISMVHTVNQLPGVRMEERSPGSYRFNIRGSTLRSPFGVRNIKVYYNGIPFTDPGGSTYLNQLGYYQFASLEILKGPAGSVYGAGTGGVLLIESIPSETVRGLQGDVTGGSFGLFQAHLALETGKNGFRSRVGLQHFTSEGYREHSALRRSMVHWDLISKIGKSSSLDFHFTSGELFYETPGALTISEFNDNPRAARPVTFLFPSAIASGAAIRQRMAVAGGRLRYSLSGSLKGESILYGTYTQISNPTFRNYEIRKEPHWGFRKLLTLQTGARGQLQAGGEFQAGRFSVDVYGNRKGKPDTVQTRDKALNRQAFAFVQFAQQLDDWHLQTGVSLNFYKTVITGGSVPLSGSYSSSYNPQLAPRLALLREISKRVSVYAIVARGFSPPTQQELLPGTGTVSEGLQPERGWNFELGSRALLLNGRLFAELNLFSFQLEQTISLRRDLAGGDFFVNAGRSRQLGLESMLRYKSLPRKGSGVEQFEVIVSHNWHRFRYGSFRKDTMDLSGRPLPGVPLHSFNVGWIVKTSFFASLSANWNYQDLFPLNDAQTVFSKPVHLVSIRADLRVKRNGIIFVGAENLLDNNYSLGYDINGAAGRYYNAAPGRNFFLGCSIKLM